MPDTVYRFVLNHQDIYLDHLQYLFPLGFLLRDEVIPSGITIPDESPIKPEYEIEEEYERCYEMDKPNHAEPIAEISLRSRHDRGRIGDDKACHAEYDDTERIHPRVIPIHTLLLNVSYDSSWLYCFLECINLVHIFSFLVIQMHGTSQTRIERVDRPKNL